jgi:hypothetical protein
MCIIAYKPHSVKIMDKPVLEACWESNSDGAGMAWYDLETDTWQVRKGYMTFKKFWKAYKAQSFTEKDVVICHFRIGTSGLKDGGNTHPFPVVENCEDMREVSFACKSILFHNGVVGRGEGDFSDTMIYVRDYIAPIVDKLGVHDKMPLIYTKLLEGASRWIITKGDKLWRFGSSWHEENGWFFSNTTFKPKSCGYASIYTTNRWASNVPDTPYFSGEKNPKWRNHTEGYANEYGRMVNGKWVHWNKEEISATKVTNFDKLADQVNDDGTINFTKARKKKGKVKNKDKEVHTHSIENGAEQRNASLFCVVEEDGSLKWGEKSQEYLRFSSVQFLICPNCYEDKNISCYAEDANRTICINCGSIFEDTTGEVLMVDLAIYRGRWKSKTIDEITTKPSNFAKLTPADRQAIIDSETDEMLHYNYM